MWHFCGKLFEHTEHAILRLFFSKTESRNQWHRMTLKQYVTLYGSKMFPQTKLGTPILREIQKC